MIHYFWSKKTLSFLLITGLVLIGLNIYAQVKESSIDLKTYLQNKICPNFELTNVENFNDLTMKDLCTGLNWARYELPTFNQVNDTTPGYTWDEANTACNNLQPAGMFRLPTVEELLTLIKKNECANTDCSTKADVLKINGVEPVFSNAIYWAKGEFNEPAGYSDYKRSVNLMNGEVDSPVFSKDMRMNAVCIVNKAAGILDKKFIFANTVPITNGFQVTGGTLKTVYQRTCDIANDDCPLKITGTACAALPPAPIYGCLNNDPANASFCPSPNGTDLQSPMAKSLVLFCNDDPTQCEFSCNVGYVLNIDHCNELPIRTEWGRTYSGGYPVGTTVTFGLKAIDNDGNVSMVEFYKDGSKVGEDTTVNANGDYEYIWSNIEIGTHIIGYKIFDNENGITSDLSFDTIIVQYPPTIEISSPLNLATFTSGDDVAIIATATDSDGTIAKVEFYKTDFTTANKIGEVTSAPYTITWPDIAVGTYILNAKAFDNLGAGTNTITGTTITVNPPAYSCTGSGPTIPTTATLCDNDETGIIGGDVARRPVNYCTDAIKCEYLCNSGLVANIANKTCVSGKLVFVTSTATSGDLGGFDGADTTCMTEAATHLSGRTFKAWLSGLYLDEQYPQKTFNKSLIPYFLISGEKVGDNFTNLVVYHAINTDINGVTNIADNVWTNTTSNGYPALATGYANCNGFTGGSLSPVGRSDSISSWSLTSTWLADALSCDSATARLYCFEQ